MIKQQLGAAIFDNPQAYNPELINIGCYTLGRGDNETLQTEKIGGTGELANNVKWLSNITSDTAYHVQLKNTPKILDDRYLRVAVSSILLELGLKQATIETKAKVISNLFNNVMLLAANIFAINEVPKGSLAGGIANKIGHFHPKIEDTSLREATAKSVLAFVNCEIKNFQKQKVEFVSIVLPRVSHTEKLFAAGLPWDDAMWLSNDQIPPKADRVRWICASSLPMLAEIQIESIDSKFNGLLNWGNGAGSLKRPATYEVSNDRQFVTSNELRSISNFCKINIERVAICASETESRYELPSLNPLAKASYSYGLLCENFWCAMLRDKDGNYTRSMMSSWLHAEDRMLCLEFAKKLQDLGYSVKGYGYGRITLAVEESAKAYLKRDALDLGLLPYLDVETLNSSTDITETDTPEAMNKLLYASSSLSNIQYLDNLFVDEVVNG